MMPYCHTVFLPPEITQLDKSFQTDVQCQIHTAYGDTDVLLINGITREGGAVAAFKSALTSSLGHQWLSDSFGINVQSLMAHKGEPHTPLDDMIGKVAMVEETNDSLLFTHSIAELREMCISMECFQFAYGWTTAWDKSEVSIINSHLHMSTSILLPSIDTGNPASPDTVSHSIPVCPDKIIFLRTPINDEIAHFNSLLSSVDNFSIPRFVHQLPLTVIQKIINQLLISKLHAQIALHPITPSHMSALESHITSKIHAYFSFPFIPSSQILHLPISHPGFGFYSISWFNDPATVSSVLWDLIHHIPLFHIMAQITIEALQYPITPCIFPFSSEGLHISYHLSCPSIPILFTLVHCVLCTLKLNIVPSDQSTIMRGEISFIHLACHVPNSPHITMLSSYIHSPYQFL